MKDTSIVWTDHTWNFIRARNKETGKKGWMCEKVSKGCNFCYAETLNQRFGNRLPYNKQSIDQVEFYMANAKEPDQYDEPALIFVHSMTDTFLKYLPDIFRHRLFDIIESYPQHEFQILTKRALEMYKFSMKRPFPKNAWAGVTIEDASQLGRLTALRKVNAEIKWISMEPMLGQIPWMDLKDVNWIVIGGESGSHMWDKENQEHRGLVTYDKAQKKWFPKPESVTQVQRIHENCNMFGTAFLHKQWGGCLPHSAGRDVVGTQYNGFPRLPKNHKYGIAQ
jgi:protein gp37